jgi:hypothetical protein
MSYTVDDEWASFISGAGSNVGCSYGLNFSSNTDLNTVDDDDDCDNDSRESHKHYRGENVAHESDKQNNALTFKNMCVARPAAQTICVVGSPGVEVNDAPTPTDIYISTKSKIEYLNTPIDIKHLFWNIAVMPYSTPNDGVIKKQIKFNSQNKEELEEMQLRLRKELHYEEHIIKSIDNPEGRVKFKDVRKLSIGMSKKDILCDRAKKKGAFYNCLVIIFRLKIEDAFREFHIKIFNTGKIELPGMQTEWIHKQILEKILQIIQPHIESTVQYMDLSDTILINSNFHCGFYVNREKLCSLLKSKYGIETIYDGCSYPGVQCKLYYDTEQDVICLKPEKKDIVKVCFMVFRTGSVLIVGMFNETVLYKVYDFVKEMLQTEYHVIGQRKTTEDDVKKPKVLRKKMVSIQVTNSDGSMV